MNIGKLSRSISIEVGTETKDGSGFASTSWAEHVATWAKIEPMAGREYLGNDQVESDTTHKFIMRYTSGVLPKMRIVYDSRYFDIQSVINMKEESRFLIVMAVERVS